MVSALGGEGSLLDVGRDERPWLCQRGLAEYMKRAWNLDDDAVAYWRAYEDFRGFVTEPVWDLVRELATDARSRRCCAPRCTTGSSSRNMRRAWNEIVAGRYTLPDFVWPPPGASFQAGAEQTHEEMIAELGDFCLGLTRPAGDRVRAPAVGQGVARGGQGAGEATSSTSTPPATSPASCRARRRRARSAPSRRRSRPSRAAI